ncbi:MAG TPA: hypothetical protein PLQ36_02240 [Candidatus Gracilibacteria bacterium]|nr:hypothetical protein [Candidatus Gracilibacteria bacterium]
MTNLIQKIRLKIKSDAREEILLKWQKAGILMFNESFDPQTEGDLVKIQELIDYLSQSFWKISWHNRFFGKKAVYDQRRMGEIAKQFNWKGIYEQMQALKKKAAELAAKEKYLLYWQEKLQDFAFLRFSALEYQSLQRFKVLFVNIPNPDALSLKAEFEKDLVVLDDNVHQHPYQSWVLIGLLEKEAQVREKLNAVMGAEIIEWPAECQDWTGFRQNIKNQILKLRTEQKNYQEQLKDLALNLPKIKSCYDVYANALERKFLLHHAEKEGEELVWTAWIRQEDLKQFSQWNNVHYQLLTPYDDDIIPLVPINNGPWQVLQDHGLFSPLLRTSSLVGFLMLNLLAGAFLIADVIYALLFLVLLLALIVKRRIPKSWRIYLLLGTLMIFSASLIGLWYGSFAGLHFLISPLALWDGIWLKIIFFALFALISHILFKLEARYHYRKLSDWGVARFYLLAVIWAGTSIAAAAFSQHYLAPALLLSSKTIWYFGFWGLGNLGNLIILAAVYFGGIKRLGIWHWPDNPRLFTPFKARSYWVANLD